MSLKRDAQLLAWYEGSYVFPAPPVCHAGWGPRDWIKYIAAHGRFQNFDHYTRRAYQVRISSEWFKLEKKRLV
jgi:hypothetical protein